MGDFSDGLESFFDSFLRGHVHTAQPGIVDKIVSTNPPIINVQPCFMRVREGSDTPEKRPIIPNVPLIFPVFGDFGIVAPVKVGAEVLVIAAERSIKTWMEQGGVVDPGIDRMFDLSDCIAIPGISNKKTDWTIPDDGIQVGTVDGSTSAIFKDGEIGITTGDIDVKITDKVEVAGASDFVALAKKVDDSIAAIKDAITNAATTPMDGGAAFKAAIVAALNISLPLIGSVAAAKLKTE